MSRVGKAPIKVPAGVKIDIREGVVKAEGPKGKLQFKMARGVSAKLDKDVITVLRDEKLSNNAAALHGLTRTCIYNIVHGVHVGFSKDLEIVGVGYRAAVKWQTLSLTLGYSHPIDYVLPAGITARVDANTKVNVTGADKVLVGMVAAKIRSFKEPEPYQGKGVRYVNEHIIRKQGKAAAGGK